MIKPKITIMVIAPTAIVIIPSEVCFVPVVDVVVLVDVVPDVVVDVVVVLVVVVVVVAVVVVVVVVVLVVVVVVLGGMTVTNTVSLIQLTEVSKTRMV